MVTDDVLSQPREGTMHPITAIVCVVFMIIIVVRWGRIFIQMHRQKKTKRNTKKDNSTLVVMLVMTGLLASCGDPLKMEDEVRSAGLMGEHELRRIEQTAGVDGYISGDWGMFGGSLDGKITEERKLQFYWGRTADEFISTTFPYSMFRFIIDETKQTPTVEFVFDEGFLQIDLTRRLTDSEKANPNDWFKRRSGSSLVVVIVRICLTDFKSGIYFQK